METIQANLYDHPRYYDLVYGSDWRAELRFLKECFKLHTPLPVRDVFEPACGTGRLLYRLARAGYSVSGIDLNAKAVQYCNARLRRHNLPESAAVGDMTDFELPRPADAAFNMINSFRHLELEEQAEAHLQCMARAVRPAGLYVLGLHLTPLAGATKDEECWSARRGHLCVNTRMWTIDFDHERRLERLGMTYDVHTPLRSFRLADEFAFRTYTVNEFRDLIDRTGVFTIEQTYDFAYNTKRPVEIGRETSDVVFVLRRRSPANAP